MAESKVSLPGSYGYSLHFHCDHVARCILCSISGKATKFQVSQHIHYDATPYTGCRMKMCQLENSETIESSRIISFSLESGGHHLRAKVNSVGLHTPIN